MSHNNIAYINRTFFYSQNEIKTCTTLIKLFCRNPKLHVVKVASNIIINWVSVRNVGENTAVKYGYGYGDPLKNVESITSCMYMYMYMYEIKPFTQWPPDKNG